MDVEAPEQPDTGSESEEMHASAERHQPREKPHHFWIGISVNALLATLGVIASVLLSTHNVDKQLRQSLELSKAQRDQASELLDRQLKASSELLDRQVKANAEAVQQQIRASFTVIDRQFRLQREQLDEQDNQAKTRASAERKAQSVKDLTEALADYEAAINDYIDTLSGTALHSAWTLTAVMQLPTAQINTADTVGSDHLFSSATRVTSARSKLRSSLANAERLCAPNGSGTNSALVEPSFDAVTHALAQERNYSAVMDKSTYEKLGKMLKELLADKSKFSETIEGMVAIRNELTSKMMAQERLAIEAAKKLIAALQDSL